MPSVCVSPFLNSSDSSAVSKLISLSKTKAEDLRINTLARETDRYNSLGLLDVLSPLSIDLDYNASDFPSAISRSGELLSNQGIITHEYTNSMVELYESIGPYIVFTKGVALAHSNKMEYVDRTGVSLVRLSSPVESGHPENDPVDVLFACATPSPTSHSRVIIELGKLISSDGVQRIRLAKTPDEVLRFIDEVLEND